MVIFVLLHQALWKHFAVQFDSLLQTRAQRHGFRTYLSGLLLPRDRSKRLFTNLLDNLSLLKIAQ